MRPYTVVLRCLEDNYAFLWHDPSTATTIAIDAPDAGVILEALEERGWPLHAILVTHHHKDHIQGIPLLKEQTGACVYGPEKGADLIPGLDAVVKDGQVLLLGTEKFYTLATPGHTADSTCYYAPRSQALFCGDTLFCLGCGRINDSTAALLFHSLQRLCTLPEETKLYYGHGYRYSNGLFALWVDGDNPLLQRRLLEEGILSPRVLEKALCSFRNKKPLVFAKAHPFESVLQKDALQEGLLQTSFARHEDPPAARDPSLYKTAAAYVEDNRTEALSVPCLAIEKQTNPFLTPKNPAIAHALGLDPSSAPLTIFTALRAQKDAFCAPVWSF